MPAHHLLKIRDLFAMRSHFGWAHALLSRAHESRLPGISLARPALDGLFARMERRTHRRTAEFDHVYGIKTFQRLDVKVSADAGDGTVWGYAAINQDFFREIMRSIPVALEPYTFVDVGSGMGAAVFLASELPFRRLVGVELTPELVSAAVENTAAFNERSPQKIAPEWIQTDFFKWKIPNEPEIFFFNNPFPEAMTLDAIQYIEQSLTENPRPLLLALRKLPRRPAAYLQASPRWTPLRLAPYWRVYRNA
jgi:SAM-dependent methyltransferase